MSIGDCPRCGAETDDENDLCYQCALRRVDISINEDECSHNFEYVTTDYFQFKVCSKCAAIED